MKRYRAVGLDDDGEVMASGFWWIDWKSAVDDVREMSKRGNPYAIVVVEVQQ